MTKTAKLEPLYYETFTGCSFKIIWELSPEIWNLPHFQCVKNPESQSSQFCPRIFWYKLRDYLFTSYLGFSKDPYTSLSFMETIELIHSIPTIRRPAHIDSLTLNNIETGAMTYLSHRKLQLIFHLPYSMDLNRIFFTIPPEHILTPHKSTACINCKSTSLENALRDTYTAKPMSIQVLSPVPTRLVSTATGNVHRHFMNAHFKLKTSSTKTKFTSSVNAAAIRVIWTTWTGSFDKLLLRQEWHQVIQRSSTTIKDTTTSKILLNKILNHPETSSFQQNKDTLELLIVTPCIIRYSFKLFQLFNKRPDSFEVLAFEPFSNDWLKIKEKLL